ncbi:MAG: ribosome biogenesis GTP-binding protein YihA/YsxC [Kiloniellales bacterium]|nr:ribosome biogenesis GTP-binding protein YihA/YsxC [Kiloniellales bacterium]
MAQPDREEGTKPALADFARWLFAQDCGLIVSAAQVAQLPPTERPEVAFAGRSNVGKSSLVNALTGRKTLARTSNTPGRTRLLNFFDLGGRLTLVDLPGYGYAQAGKAEIRQWTGLTRDYLRGRVELRRVCLLIDARHGVKDSDRSVMKLLDEAAVPFQVVFTKADKVKPGALATLRAATEKELAGHPAAFPVLLATSSISGAGIEALRAALAALAEGAPEDARGEDQGVQDGGS